MSDIEKTATADAADLVPVEEVQLCLFRIGADTYALPVGTLAEIIIPQKIFPVPTTPPHLLGVINLRGNIVPIVDIRPALGAPPGDGRPQQIAVLRHGPVVLGIAVDEVAEVLSIPVTSLLDLPAEHGMHAQAGSRSRFFRAVIQHGDRAAALLDTERLLEAVRFA